MPANLTPEFLAARQRFNQAKSDEERTEALQEMLATIPKHKGTEKMQADLRRRLAKLKERAEQRRRSGKSGGPSHHVEPEGAAQIALVGPPNSGKSSLVAALTNAKTEIAPYPMSTFRPIPGMMPYEDVQIQLVDLPPITAEYTEGWVFSAVRTADAVALCWNLADDESSLTETQVLEMLAERHVRLSGGLSREVDWRAVERRTLLVAMKLDLSPDGLARAEEWAGGRFSVVGVSVETGDGLEECRRRLFEIADVVRVYSKKPGHDPDMQQPYTLRSGATVLDVVEHVHREFVEKLRFVRLWGSSKFDGQHAPMDHQVRDGDILEIHLA